MGRAHNFATTFTLKSRVVYLDSKTFWYLSRVKSVLPSEWSRVLGSVDIDTNIDIEINNHSFVRTCWILNQLWKTPILFHLPMMALHQNSSQIHPLVYWQPRKRGHNAVVIWSEKFIAVEYISGNLLPVTPNLFWINKWERTENLIPIVWALMYEWVLQTIGSLFVLRWTFLAFLSQQSEPIKLSLCFHFWPNTVGDCSTKSSGNFLQLPLHNGRWVTTWQLFVGEGDKDGQKNHNGSTLVMLQQIGKNNNSGHGGILKEMFLETYKTHWKT